MSLKVAPEVDDLGMGWRMNWLDHDNHRLLDLYIANDSHHSQDVNVQRALSKHR